LEKVFQPSANVAESLLVNEKLTSKFVEAAIRQFAATNEWPPLSPLQEVMLSFRLDFAASVACLLAQQPAPWTDSELPDQREHRLCWLMLFAWENEGFPKLHKTLQRLSPPTSNPP